MTWKWVLRRRVRDVAVDVARGGVVIAAVVALAATLRALGWEEPLREDPPCIWVCGPISPDVRFELEDEPLTIDDGAPRAPPFVYDDFERDRLEHLIGGVDRTFMAVGDSAVEIYMGDEGAHSVASRSARSR